MAEVFKRKLKRYVLGGRWVEQGKGKQARRVLRGGERVRKGTPGAEEFETESREWYALINGAYVKLSPIRDKAVAQLRKQLHDAEDRRVNPFAAHLQAPLEQHIADFRDHLAAKGRDARYIREQIGRLKVVTAPCQTLKHVTAARIDSCLNDLCRLTQFERRQIAKLREAGKNDEADAIRKESRGAAPSTRNSYLSAVRSFCQWCVRERRLRENPIAHYSKLNEAVDVRRERRALDAVEADRLIRAAEHSKKTVRGLTGPDRAMLYKIALCTGYRASELASVTEASLQLDHAPPLIAVEAKHSKRRQYEEQPIPAWLAHDIRTWRSSSARRRLAAALWEWRAMRPTNEGELLRWRAARPTAEAIPPSKLKLWPGRWARHAAKVLRVDLKAAGVAYVDEAGGVADFHALRHTFITNLARSGVHPKKAQILARHSTIDLTMNFYTHVTLSDAAEALDMLPQPAPEKKTSLRATGTLGKLPARTSGDAPVTVKASSQAENWQPKRRSLESGQLDEPIATPSQPTSYEKIGSGGHGTRTHNRLPGTTFPVCETGSNSSAKIATSATGDSLVTSPPVAELRAKLIDALPRLSPRALDAIELLVDADLADRP